jgi:hypothetical protein
MGFDHLIFHSAGPDQKAFLDGYGRNVLPRLRQAKTSRAGGSVSAKTQPPDRDFIDEYNP